VADDPAHTLITAIIKSLTEPLAQQPAIPALDPADLREALKCGGPVGFGQAEASGSDRAIRAAEGALRDLKRNLKARIVE
jgi:cell division GTPase FtsZ